MAKDQSYPQSTAISKAATSDVSIADSRRTSQSFGVFAKGVRTREDIIEATAALGADLAAGKINIQDASAHCGILDRNLHVKDQELQEMEMQLRLDMLKHKAFPKGAKKSR